MNQTVKVLLIIGVIAYFGKKAFDTVFSKIIYGQTKLRTRGIPVTPTPGKESGGLKVSGEGRLRILARRVILTEEDRVRARYPCE